MFYRKLFVLSLFSFIVSCGSESGDNGAVTAESEQPPRFTNLETGNAVIPERAFWEGVRDFDGTIACQVWTFDGNSYAAAPRKILTYSYGPLSWTAPEGTVSVYDNTAETQENWSVSDSVYSGPTNLGQSLWYEVVDIEDASTKGVRSWITDNMYEDCWRLSEPRFTFAPTGNRSQETIFDDEPCVDNPTNDRSGMDASAACPPRDQGAVHTVTTVDGRSIETEPYPVSREDFEDTFWSCTDVNSRGEYAPSQATKSWQFNSNGTGRTDHVGRGSTYDDRFIWIWTEHGVQIAEFSQNTLSGELFYVNTHPDSSYWITSLPAGREFRPVNESGPYSGGKACSLSNNL